jgi:hypothetical protein
MPRSTTTVSHAYGTDRHLSFGELLVKCLTFPKHELDVDVERALEAGIEPATVETVAIARKNRDQMRNSLRRKVEKQQRRAKTKAAA